MSNSKHKWTCSESALRSDCRQIRNGEGELVATAYDVKAAEYMVECINAHHELTMLLAEARTALAKLVGSAGNGSGFKVIAAIDAALSSVTAEVGRGVGVGTGSPNY